MSRRAIFLDRDGVLNRAIVKNGKSYPPPSLDELEILPDVSQGLAMLKQAGFLLIGVTNQPDVARGVQKREVVEAINNALLKALPLDDLLVCYHDDSDDCDCRKPRPGMLLQAAVKYGITLPASYLVGDRWKDVEAGRRAGCVTLFIDYKYQEVEQSIPDYRVGSLNEAAYLIINLESKRGG
jgi:D-glycero-D-manno-heptose 1,7-bisphosphate phosphatase